MANKGLYGTAFSSPAMSADQENAKWKREERNHLYEIGAMPLILKDPNASLGYEAQQNPYGSGLSIGPFPDGQNMGQYAFVPDFEAEGLRRGNLDIKQGMSQEDYAETLVHELGHAGSRNRQSEQSAYETFNAGDEEWRQRFMDVLLHHPDTEIHKWAKGTLLSKFGPAVFERKLAQYREMMSPPSTPAPKPKPKPKKTAEAKPKKKKKYLLDFLK